jgi:hypothetical protein
MDSFSSPGGANSRNSGGTRHLSDPTRIFFAGCLIRRRENCGITAMIRVFWLTHGKYKWFRIVEANFPVKP